MKTEQHEQELVMAQIAAGAKPPPRRKLYTKRDETIFSLIKKFNDDIQDGTTFLPFMTAIAHNAELWFTKKNQIQLNVSEIKIEQ